MPATELFSLARDADEAYLELRRPGRHVTIRAAGIDALCRARFERVRPRANVEGGRVSIEYPRFSLASLFRHHAQRAEIELSPALPWSIAVHGGLGDSSLDLRGLDLRDFRVAGRASDLRLLLPSARGTIRVRIEGGASKLTLLRPRGVAATLRVRGGGSRLAFDGQRYGSIGGETRLETPNADSLENRYEIELAGGASELTISEHDGGDE
jgi:hypothetical protein